MKVTSRKGTNGEERQPPLAGRKRQRNSSKTGVPASSTAEGYSEKGGVRQTSLRISLLRRPGLLQRDCSAVQASEAVKFISREAKFMDKLPLKAPYTPDEICNDCGKTECECDPQSDSDDDEEEISMSFFASIIQNIRIKTDVVRHYSGRIVNDQGFQIFIVMLILINSLLLGVATFDFIEENASALYAFRILDFAFLVIFTIELIMQFLYHGYNLFFDGWLLFDLIIVLTSWTLESISVLRSLRLRSFKVFRAFRLTTRIRALRRLVEAIFDVLPKITAIIVMFILIMYIFAVMCTELFGEIDFTHRFTNPEMGTYDYFSRLDNSLFTLFVMVTLDWASVARATMQVYPWSWAIFSVFVTFSSFVLYNLIIAVVCDAVKMVQDQQDILMVENFVKDKIESRHRIINLRQKLDKMAKQQMDLLLYVQLILEQLDDVDEASKHHYEETLLILGQTSDNAKEALQRAIKELDEIDNNSPYKPPSRVKSTPPPLATSSQQSADVEKTPARGERNRRVSFKFNNTPVFESMSSGGSSRLDKERYNDNNDDDDDDMSDHLDMFDEFSEDQDFDDDLASSQNYFGAAENFDSAQFTAEDSSEIDDSFHTCTPSMDLDDLESSFKEEIQAVKDKLSNL